MARTLIALLIASCVALPVSAASNVELKIRDGLVSLRATDATVRQILAEWARSGGTRIINGERVPGGPQTLQLIDVPEERALEVLLRSVAGFIAAQRAVALPDQSRFDRIVILPTSSPAANSGGRVASAAPAFAPSVPAVSQPAVVPGTQRLIGADGQPVPDDQDDALGDASGRSPLPPLPAGADEPDVRPAPAMRPFPTPNAAPTIPAGVAVPGTIVPPPRASSPPAPRNQQ
jgi:hypothetical protein